MKTRYSNNNLFIVVCQFEWIATTIFVIWLAVITTMYQQIPTSMAQSIQSFSLIDTVQKKSLGIMNNTTRIDLNKFGTNLTILANIVVRRNMSASAIKNISVIFDFDNIQRYHIENTAPYTLSGDINGVYYFQTRSLVQLGTHTLSATAYMKQNGQGRVGKTYTIRFRTILGTSTPVRSPQPTQKPNMVPIRSPTRKPTKVPIRSPTRKPTKVPIRSPTRKPTKVPIRSPTRKPTKRPIRAPTKRPTRMPSKAPTQSPKRKSTTVPINLPTKRPTRKPTKVPIRPPPTRMPTNAPFVITKSSKCGAAVNSAEISANVTCNSDLWIPTGDVSQHCYAYGGGSDPCALHNNNDVDDGLYKNPLSCTRGDTFYLWDEPDTQGKNYTWAGIEWVKYATRYAKEIQILRQRGVQFTSPLLRAGDPNVIATNLNIFYEACGTTCHNPNSMAYINVNAVNAFVGPWNRPGIDGCQDAADYIVNEVRTYNDNNINGRRPWYITNWSRLGTFNVQDQVDAMNVISRFFDTSTVIVQRIYWFGATDYGGNSGNNFLTTQYTTVNGISTTLGKIWESNCNALL